MSGIKRIELNNLGYGFVPEEYLHDNSDEYAVRNEQAPESGYRSLTDEEISALVGNGNSASNWSDVLVLDPFDPEVIRRNSFHGLVRIGAMSKAVLSYHDFKVEEGITDSYIISSDIGSHSSVHHCHYISHYIIYPEVIVHSVDELQCTNHAKFGVGVIKEGESEDVRVSIDVMNESGGRSIYPFVSMTTADAYIEAKYRDRPKLQQKLKELTDRTSDLRRGVYGEVRRGTVIKSCRIIKDVWFGEGAYVKGCNKLKNLTVSSSEEESTQLGEGIELVNGVIGKGCRIFYGSKAIRFVMMAHSSLKYGARLIHSVIGENSTISCCEVLNNLVFPFHEEHHNNSFLIAALVKGQSNMAAGATIGSNHNSRGNDGELVAGRGFWPALAATVKHDSRFASFTLLSKGSYPNELNITLPFSLVADNSETGAREIMPAYWWMYNMYALVRNSYKFSSRDKRKEKLLHIETDFLAPDTVLEIMKARLQLEEWTGRSVLSDGKSTEEYRRIGRELLNDPAFHGSVYATGLENSNKPMLVLKIAEGYRAYEEMLFYYAIRTISGYADSHNMSFGEALGKKADYDLSEEWINLGGQLVPASRLEALIHDIEEDAVSSWDEVHERYRLLADDYEEDCCRLATAMLPTLADLSSDDAEEKILERYEAIRQYVRDQALLTRIKDYDNAFRHITYDSDAERDAVLGRKLGHLSFPLP